MEGSTEVKKSAWRKVRRWLLIGFGCFLILLMALCIYLSIFIVPAARLRAAKAQLTLITTALKNYNIDFHAYPPVAAGDDGSKVLAQFLCRPLKVGEVFYGPYLTIPDSNELISPLGGRYIYFIESDTQNAVIIDLGPDKKPGGTIDPKKGFVPDKSGDDKDNIRGSPYVKD